METELIDVPVRVSTGAVSASVGGKEVYTDDGSEPVVLVQLSFSEGVRLLMEFEEGGEKPYHMMSPLRVGMSLAGETELKELADAFTFASRELKQIIRDRKTGVYKSTVNHSFPRGVPESMDPTGAP